MLVLSRKLHGVVISFCGVEVRLKPCNAAFDPETGETRIRLAFDAPDGVVIDRLEVYESKKLHEPVSQPMNLVAENQRLTRRVAELEEQVRSAADPRISTGDWL